MPDPTPAETPNAVPAKFMKDGVTDVAALATAYTELEKKLGAPKPPEPTPAPTPTPTPTPEAPKPVVPPPPDSIQKFEQEFVDKGALAPESYTELQTKFHLSKGVVDDFIKFRQNQAESYAKDVTNVVGGVDSYKQIMQWATTGLTPEEATAFDTSIKSGDLNVAKTAVAGLKTKYEQANGRDPTIVGGTATSRGIMPFSNLKEAVAFRSNPKWKSDPDYQRTYKERLKISNI